MKGRPAASNRTSIGPVAQRSCRMMIWTRKNPWTLATAIGFLVSCLIVWFVFRFWSKRRLPPEVPTPHEYTVVATSLPAEERRRRAIQKSGPIRPEPESNYRLRLKITESPQQPAANETVLNQFPCVIGRDEFMEHFELSNRGSKHFLNVAGDEKVSRGHIEITVRSGSKFYLTDLDSRNGTYMKAANWSRSNPPRSLALRPSNWAGAPTWARAAAVGLLHFVYILRRNRVVHPSIIGCILTQSFIFTTSFRYKHPDQADTESGKYRYAEILINRLHRFKRLDPEPQIFREASICKICVVRR
ncbi:MAG: FHA domain-containing protein [Caldilineaceae bacterium]